MFGLTKMLGGLAGDLYEGVATVGNGIIDAPSDFVDGFKEGLITKESEPKEADAVTPGQAPEKLEPVVVKEEAIDPRDAEIAALKAQLVEQQGAKDVDPFNS